MMLQSVAAMTAMLVAADPVPPPTPPMASPVTVQAAAPAPAACCIVPADRIVELEIAAPLTSRTSRHGDAFPIRLAAPILADGAVLVPAGAAGIGEVIQGERGRMGGGPGELTLAVRYIDHGGQRIPLRRLRFFATGRNNEGTATAVMLSPVGPLAFFITGGEIRVPAGTHVQAQVAADVRISAPRQD